MVPELPQGLHDTSHLLLGCPQLASIYVLSPGLCDILLTPLPGVTLVSAVTQLQGHRDSTVL